MSYTVSSGQLGFATPFGEIANSGMTAELNDYASLGANWLRTDFWSNGSNGSNYNWTQLDNLVNAAAAKGIKVVGLLNAGSGQIDTAAERANFVSFAKAAAEHFKGRVDSWEILNEQNFYMDPTTYTNGILKPAYTAIKSVDSAAMVITGGTASIPSTGNGMYGAVDYINSIYAAGGKGYFDAVGHHPYTYPLLPSNNASYSGWEMMESGIRSAMVANGDSAKQVWMTEFGAPTTGGSNALTQTQQAQMLKEATDIAHATSWMGPIMYYSYQDRGGSTSDTENWFGVVGPNGEHKQVYDTFKSIGLNDGGATTTPTPTPTPTPSPTPTPTDSKAITGTSNNDTLTGTTGADTISGGAGADTIKAGSGNDIIKGEAGNDTLWGEGGNDTFVFESASTIGVDKIMDFATGDKIDLSAIDANSSMSGNQAFSFIGGSWLSKAGQLGAYQDKTNQLTYVQGDLNGDGKYDFSIVVKGLYAFKAADFIL